MKIPEHSLILPVLFYYLFAFFTSFQVFLCWMCIVCGFPGGASGKEPICQGKRLKRAGSLSSKDSPVEVMATHSSILAWRAYGQRSLDGYGL